MRSYLKIFDFIAAPLLTALATGLLFLEARHQLRRRKENQWKRLKTNAGLASVGLAGLRLALLPSLLAAGKRTQNNHFGIAQWLPVSKPLQRIFAFFLLDYSNYLWHRCNHQIPWLWRFHSVHHADLDMDVSTAWRFHVGEVLLSIFFRGGMVMVVGAGATTVLVYEVLYEAATAFHHSNWRLPIALERKLNKLIVTPRMHGIHHSIVQRETNSNYAVIFTFWDKFHHTIRLNIPQGQLVIGIPSYMDPSEQTAATLLKLPFQPPREWQLPDGSTPERKQVESNEKELAE